MSDDYSIAAIENKYGEIGQLEMAAMTNEERQKYYWSLYQYLGRMIGILHEPSTDSSNYPDMKAGEYSALSALNHSFMAVLDGLAVLMNIGDE